MACCRELLDLEAEDMDNSSSSGSTSSSGTEDEESEPLPGPSRAINDFTWPANRRHPLLFPHILRDVLDQLSMKDVESCREVCRRWNDEACSVIQDKKLVALLENDAMKYYVQKMEGSPYCPHTQFELHMENLSEKQPLMKTFWTSFGQNIKFLDLHQTILFLETLFQLLRERLPNLERLALRTLPRKMTRRNSHPPVPLPSSSQQQPPEYNGPHNYPSLREIGFAWFPQEDIASLGVIKDLFQSMPNLEKVSLINIIPTSSPITRGDGMTSSRVRASRLLLRVLTDPEVNLPSLTNIDFELEVGNDELEILTRKGHQFQNLSLKLTHGTKSSALKDYLTILSPNLRTLDIAFPDGFFNCGITFPACFQMRPQEVAVHLKEVTELSLHNFHGSLAFIRNLDRLKRLTVNNANFDACLPPFGFRSYDVSTSFKRDSVRDDHTLEAFKTDSVTTSSVVSSLSRCFPLLRVLHLKGINDDGLGMVYRNLPYLVELVIANGKCSDQGISGVPLEVCVDMAETATFKLANPEKYRRDLFLGSLQYLKTVRISSDSITDVSIAFGIVDCKNLRDLTLRSAAITDTGVIKIADRMSKQLERLDVIHCESVTEDGKFYMKEKMKGVTLLVEPQCVHRSRPVQNPNRQMGYPFRGRLGRPTDRENEFVVGGPGMDDEYGRLPMRDRLVAIDRRRRLHHRMGYPQFRLGFGREPLWYQHQHHFDDVLGNPPPPIINPAGELGLVHDFMDSDDEEEEDEMEMEAMEFNEQGLELEEGAVENEVEVFIQMPMNFIPPSPNFMELLEGNVGAAIEDAELAVPADEYDYDILPDPAPGAE